MCLEIWYICYRIQCCELKICNEDIWELSQRQRFSLFLGRHGYGFKAKTKIIVIIVAGIFVLNCSTELLRRFYLAGLIDSSFSRVSSLQLTLQLFRASSISSIFVFLSSMFWFNSAFVLISSFCKRQKWLFFSRSDVMKCNNRGK